MKMARGENLLCSPKLIENTLNDASEADVNMEKERLRDMFFLHRSDKTGYGEMLEDLNKRSYKGRDE